MTKNNSVVKVGQIYNEICVYSDEFTGNRIEVLDIKEHKNGKAAALVEKVDGKADLGAKFGLKIVDGGLPGYEIDIYSPVQ